MYMYVCCGVCVVVWRAWLCVLVFVYWMLMMILTVTRVTVDHEVLDLAEEMPRMMEAIVSNCTQLCWLRLVVESNGSG